MRKRTLVSLGNALLVQVALPTQSNAAESVSAAGFYFSDHGMVAIELIEGNPVDKKESAETMPLFF